MSILLRGHLCLDGREGGKEREGMLKCCGKGINEKKKKKRIDL